MQIKFILILLLSSISCYSQKATQLIISYGVESRINYDELDEKIKSNPTQLMYFKKLQKDYTRLEYSLNIENTAAEFKLVNKLYSTDGNPNYVAMAEKSVRYYVDEKVSIEQREAFGEEYLIADRSNNFEWIITTNQKSILGYNCFKATYQKERMTIDAWFAPELPFNFGPKGYHGLPGLILEVVQNSKLAYIASSITEDSEVWVLKPTTGKQISREEYESRISEAAKAFKDYNKN